MKTKVSQETVKAFSSMITKRNRPKNIWVDKVTELAGAYKKFCAAEGIQVYSTILYSKPSRKFKKPTFKNGDRVRISKYDLPFRKVYKPQFTREVFEIVTIATRKTPTNTNKDEQGEVVQGKFYQKELIKVI